MGVERRFGPHAAGCGQVPSTDVLSYTAQGRPFVYPPASLLALYGLHNLGGYAALSWFGALCCLATVALVLAGAHSACPSFFSPSLPFH